MAVERSDVPDRQSAPGRPSSTAFAGEIRSDLEAGEVALLVEGDLATARSHFEAAARRALAAEEAGCLARAALGLGGLWVHEHRTAIEASRVAAWQQRALDLLEHNSPLAVRLRTRLAAEQDYSRGKTDAILAALADARASNDLVALADALSLTHHCLLAPEHAGLRLQLSEELLGLASLTGRRVDEVLGLLWRTVDLLLIGDPHAERSRRELGDVTARHKMQAIDFVLAAMDVMLCIRRGELETAERRAAACFQRGEQVGDLDAQGWYAAQLVNIRWFQGRMAELIPMLTQLVNSPTLAAPNESILSALAVASAQVGDTATAIGALQRIRGRSLGELTPSSTWLVTLCGMIEAAALLGDKDLATEAYDLLAPYARWPIMASLAVVCFGSVHFSLARAAVVAGRLETAAAHLSKAIAANQALDHRPALQQSERSLKAVRDLLRSLPARDSVSCRRAGDGWLVEQGGRQLTVSDSVGMRYLATLLGQPGRDISAAQLAGVLDHTGGVPAAVIDDDARRAYARRARELQTELEEAEAAGRQEDVARARSELDWLLAEVERATGLGGRSRRFADDQERARTSVQKAIRRALGQIAKVDPELAQSLAADIVTGSRCCYRPR